MIWLLESVLNLFLAKQLGPASHERAEHREEK